MGEQGLEVGLVGTEAGGGAGGDKGLRWGWWGQRLEAGLVGTEV